jgi:hypothetical protein
MSDYKLDPPDDRPEIDPNQCAICGSKKLTDSDLCQSCEDYFEEEEKDDDY